MIINVDSMRTNRYDRHQKNTKNLLTILDVAGQATKEKVYVYTLRTEQQTKGITSLEERRRYL
jgi:hypothetical protein